MTIAIFISHLALHDFHADPIKLKSRLVFVIVDQSTWCLIYLPQMPVM